MISPKSACVSCSNTREPVEIAARATGGGFGLLMDDHVSSPEQQTSRGESLETSSLIRAKQRGKTSHTILTHTHATSSAGEMNPCRKTETTDVMYLAGLPVFHVTHQILSLSNPLSILDDRNVILDVHSQGPKLFCERKEKI